MRVLVYGWYGHGNVGDESYRLSLPRLFPGDELRFTDDAGLEDPAGYDVLVLGGGNILDRHHVGKLNRMKAQGRLARPVYGFSLGFTDESVSAADLGLFRRIMVRDRPAYDRLVGMGLGERAALVPDAAYALEPDAERGRRVWEGYFRHYKRDLYDRRVAVVVNSHLCGVHGAIGRDELRFLNFAHDLAALLDGMAASVLFVPFGTALPWDDRVSNGWVASKCKWWKKTHVLADNLGVRGAMDVLAAADAVISMRLHSTIFSVVAGVPFLDIYHHDKNRWNLETLGLEDWGLSYWDFSRGRAGDLLEGRLAERARCERLHRVREEQRQKLRGGVDGIRFDQQA